MFRDAMGTPLPPAGPPVQSSKLPAPDFTLEHEPIDPEAIQSAMLRFLAEVESASNPEIVSAMREYFGPETGRDAERPYATTTRTRFYGKVRAVMRRRRLRTLGLVKDVMAIPEGKRKARKVGIAITPLGAERAAAGLV